MKNNLIKIISTTLAIVISGTCLSLNRPSAAILDNNISSNICMTEVNDDIPLLVSVIQVAPDTMEVHFSLPVNIEKATNPNNYWIQTLDQESPKDIATLGKNEKLTTKNSLTKDKASISQKESSDKTFVIKLAQSIPSKANYRLFVFFIPVTNATEYKGLNGSFSFTGK